MKGSNHGMPYKMLVGKLHHENGVQGAQRVQDWWKQEEEGFGGRDSKNLSAPMVHWGFALKTWWIFGKIPVMSHWMLAWTLKWCVLKRWMRMEEKPSHIGQYSTVSLGHAQGECEGRWFCSWEVGSEPSCCPHMPCLERGCSQFSRAVVLGKKSTEVGALSDLPGSICEIYLLQPSSSIMHGEYLLRA